MSSQFSTYSDPPAPIPPWSKIKTLKGHLSSSGHDSDGISLTKVPSSNLIFPIKVPSGPFSTTRSSPGFTHLMVTPRNEKQRRSDDGGEVPTLKERMDGRWGEDGEGIREEAAESRDGKV